MLGKSIRNIMGLETNFICIIKDLYPTRLFLPYIISFILVTIEANDIFYIIPFFLFIILNQKAFIKVISVLKNVINNPQFLNI